MEDDLQRAAAQNADAVVRRFFDSAGHLKNLPAKQSRQLAVFDLIAQRFVPGVRYTETEVNHELMQVFDDYVSLRRGLVDFGLLDRADGRYWRSWGGTVPVDAPAAAKGRPNPSERSNVPRDRPVGARGRPPRGDPGPAGRRETVCRPWVRRRRMDDIGAAAGVTGPAIYPHFGAKASVLTAVFDRVIDAVAYDRVEVSAAPDSPEQDAARLRELVVKYADAVCGRRRLMAVFVREVHHLPAEDRAALDERQRVLVRKVAHAARARASRLGHGAGPHGRARRVRHAQRGRHVQLTTAGRRARPADERAGHQRPAAEPAGAGRVGPAGSGRSNSANSAIGSNPRDR